MSDDETEFGAKAAERPTFFSDAVVAIAITLLAIDLPVPEGSTVGNSGLRLGTTTATTPRS